MSTNLTPEERLAYKQAFDFFDGDQSGQISTTELGKAMGKLGYNLNATQVQEILQHVDTDGNDQIGFDEFLVFIQQAGN